MGLEICYTAEHMVEFGTKNQPVKQRQAQFYSTTSNRNTNDGGWHLWQASEGQKIVTHAISIFPLSKWILRKRVQGDS